MLTDADLRLIEKRRGMLRHLKTATWLLPLVWLAIFVIMAIRYPLLVNPWKLGTMIQSGELGRTSAESLAALSPLLVLLVQLLVIVTISGGLAMLYRERRLLGMIEAMRKEEGR